MNTETLKNLQAPLKEKYREHPESAVITLKAEGKIGEGISCNVATAQAMVEAGLHRLEDAIPTDRQQAERGCLHAREICFCRR